MAEGALHTLVSLLCLYCNAFPTCASASGPLIQAVSQLTGTRGQCTWERFKRSRQRQASIFSARTGNLCLYPPPSSPFIIPTLNCRGQESKTSLSEDQEALGWGAWLGYDRAGAPVPGPTREKGKIMLDKFRRTGPASLALGCSFSYLTLLLKSLLVALPLGGSVGNAERSGPHLPPLLCAQVSVPTSPSCSLPGSPWGSFSHFLALRSPFPPHLKPEVRLEAALSEGRPWSWPARTDAENEHTQVPSPPLLPSSPPGPVLGFAEPRHLKHRDC